MNGQMRIRLERTEHSLSVATIHRNAVEPVHVTVARSGDTIRHLIGAAETEMIEVFPEQPEAKGIAMLADAELNSLPVAERCSINRSASMIVGRIIAGEVVVVAFADGDIVDLEGEDLFRLLQRLAERVDARTARGA